MIAPNLDPLLDALEQFVSEMRTAEDAARQIGIQKGTLSKWRSKRAIGLAGLQKLAGTDHAELAAEARKVLVALGRPISRFNYAHAAAQMISVGFAPGYLLAELEAKASEDHLDVAAVADLVSVFVYARYFEALSFIALTGFTQKPEHRFRDAYIPDYIRYVFDDDEGDEDSGIVLDSEGRIDIENSDWEKYDEPHHLRFEAAEKLIDCVKTKSPHRLFELINDLTECPTTPLESVAEYDHDYCLVKAASAAVDMYRYESAVEEASDTLRRGGDLDRALERRPLYTIATRIYEICSSRRQYMVQRVDALLRSLPESEPQRKRLMDLVNVVHAALYSDKGVYIMHGQLADGVVNAHGSLFDFRWGQIRNLVGKKRKAPRRGVVREPSIRAAGRMLR